MESTFWPYKRDPYDIFTMLLEDPRMPKSQMARRLKVNPNTLSIWWKAAIEKRIIVAPIFRRKSFLNFREYFYFINARDPHDLYENLQNEDPPLSYFSVQTGFCNFQIISPRKLSLNCEVVLSGDRSDYYVTIPQNKHFETSTKEIYATLRDLRRIDHRESPLRFHDEVYEPWDQKDEIIFQEVCNNLRTPFASVVRAAETYNDKAWTWFRERDNFGSTITMFFPRGEGSYILSLYIIETLYDSLLIDIFSKLPTSTIFYRLDGKLVMGAYLPFSLKGRSVVRKALSILQKEELVGDYTNSIVEYFYRP